MLILSWFRIFPGRSFWWQHRCEYQYGRLDILYHTILCQDRWSWCSYRWFLP